MPITTMQGETNVWRKDRDEGSGVGDIWGVQERKVYAASEIKVAHQKCSPLMKRFCETTVCFK